MLSVSPCRGYTKWNLKTIIFWRDELSIYSRAGRAGPSHFRCQQAPFLCIIDLASVINTWGRGCHFLFRYRLLGVFRTTVEATRAASPMRSKMLHSLTSRQRCKMRSAGPSPDVAVLRPCHLRHRSATLGSWKQSSPGAVNEWKVRRWKNPGFLSVSLIAHSQTQLPIIRVNFNESYNHRF